MEYANRQNGGDIMTALFQYVPQNKPLSRAFFAKLTDPGQGDLAITRLGFDIRQSLAGTDTYTYTAIDGTRPVTLAWLNVAAGGMNISFGYNGRHEINAADLPGIVAKLVVTRPELRHPARAIEAVGEPPEEEIFVHCVDNNPDEIPFDGRPVVYESEADDYGLELAW